MRLGTEDKKKLITAGVAAVFALFGLGYLYIQLYGGPSTPPPQPVAQQIAQPAPVAAAPAAKTTGGAATKVGSVSGQLDPTLHMEGMLAAESLVYTGSGRNIFNPGPMQAPVQVATVKAIAPARPNLQAALVQQPSGPPPSPPINLRFFGTATQRGVKRALLLSGDDVFLASTGEIVARRYKIVTIAPNLVVVEDMPNNNQQALPLIVN